MIWQYLQAIRFGSETLDRAEHTWHLLALVETQQSDQQIRHQMTTPMTMTTMMMTYCISVSGKKKKVSVCE
jgi:hypothetical protein